MKNDGTILSSTNKQNETLGFINQLKIPGLIIFILVTALLILLYYLNIKVQFASAYFNLTLYLIFIIIPSIVIAFITSRGFLRTGTWPVLWLGIGALTFGIANLLSSLLLSLSMNNAAVTTGNLIIFLSTIFYLFGAFFIFNKINDQENKSKRLSTVIQVYLGALILITFITIISIKGYLPPFFIQGVGGTHIRQIILGLSAIFFLISSLMILRQYSNSKSIFLYWYGLGILLISIGTFGAFLTTTLGSPFNWMARVTQLLGGVYLIVAAIIVFKTATAKNIRAEDALTSFFSLKESHLNKLLKNIRDAIIISDNKSNITGWNNAAEKTYGWTATEALGKNATNLLQTHYPDEINSSNLLNDSFKNEDWSGEVTQKHKNGRVINILTSISPMEDGNDLFNGTIAINRDITDRKLAEELKQKMLDKEQELTEQLQSSNEELKAIAEELQSSNEELRITGMELQSKNVELRESEDKLKELVNKLKISNRELEQFAYVSSHDLQEPIRMITSFTQLLERRYKGKLDADADDYIDFIVEGAHRMKYLIDDLLAFSRVSSDTKEFENVDLENVLDNVLSNLSVSIEENDAVITHDLLPTIVADSTQIMQVFQNLIANAIKFHGSNPPKINISAQKNSEEWRFSVSDNGIGIEPEYQKKIFEVFKRLHTRDEYPGSGVGLSISQKIVRRHCGNIWVESEPGKGSTFYFTIPLNINDIQI